MKPGLAPSYVLRDPLRGRRTSPVRALPVRLPGALPPEQLAPAASAVFLFSGLGADHAAMGARLYRVAPVFRRELHRCDRAYRATTGEPLLAHGDRPFARLARVRRPSYVHPAVFSYQYALALMWIACGIRPAALLGYSLGEDAAACVSGAASVEDLMPLVVARARRVEPLRGGAMAVVFAGVPHTSRLMAGLDGLDIAAANGPDSTVVSGPASSIEMLLAIAAHTRVHARRVRAACAFHSRAMDAVVPQLEADAAAVAFHAPAIPILSGVSAEWATLDTLHDPRYWGRRVRAPIRFADAIQRLHERGHRVFVEIGPHPMLLPLVRRRFMAADLACVETARRDQDDALVTAVALAQLTRLGADLDLGAVLPAPRAAVARLTPTHRLRRFEVSG